MSHIILAQITDWGKSVAGALIFLVVSYGAVWIKKVFDQKRRNTLNEIDLSAKKINLDNSSKPLDALVSNSNASHGVSENEMVGPARNDDKKKQ